MCRRIPRRSSTFVYDPQPSKLKKKEKYVHNLLMWESETLELIIESRKIRDHDRHNAFCETQVYFPPHISQVKSIMTGTPQVASHASACIALDLIYGYRARETASNKRQRYLFVCRSMVEITI
jgi:hypothetical protein